MAYEKPHDLKTLLLQRTQAYYVSSFTSYTGAFELLLRVLNLRGKKIVFQGNEHPAFPFAAERAGCYIDFVDIDPETLDIDLESLKRMVKVGNVGAIFVNGVAGRVPQNMSLLKEKYGSGNIHKDRIYLIENVGDGLGSIRRIDRYEYRAGNWADFAIINLHRYGGGAAISTDDDKIIQECEDRAKFGFDDTLDIGMSEQFQQVVFNEIEKDDIKYRREVVTTYKQLLPPTFFFDYGESSYHKLPLRLSYNFNVELFKNQCVQHKIELDTPIFEIPCYKSNLLAGRYEHLELPGSERYCRTHICAPMQKEAVAGFARALKSFMLNGKIEEKKPEVKPVVKPVLQALATIPDTEVKSEEVKEPKTLSKIQQLLNK